MKKIKFIVFTLITGLLGCSSSDELPNNENQVISKTDLEILSKTDIANSGHPFLWRCYSLETVRPSFRTWKDTDPLGAHNVIVTMCELKISANDTFSLNEYNDTRGRDVSNCDEFMSAWKILTLNENKICIAGRQIQNSMKDNEEPQTAIVNWIWDKIKTKKGCYGFWDGYDC